MKELEKFGNFLAISAQVFKIELPWLVLIADVPTMIIGFVALNKSLENYLILFMYIDR